MTPEELTSTIERLRRQGSDDASTEAKRCQHELQKDVWESVSAFGNTHGGVLIFGLDEKSGFKPVDGFELEKVRDSFVSGMGDGGYENRKVENAPQYELERHEFEGRPLLVVELAEVDPRLKPCFILSRDMKNGSYKRVDDKDVKLSPAEIFELQNALVESSADREIVHEATEADFDQALVNALVAEAKRRGSKAVKGVEGTQEALARLNALNNAGEVRLAGLLALGSYPQQYFPKLSIDVAVHPDVEKSDPDGPRFIDREVCEGPLVEVIDDAIRAISRNLRRYSIVEGAGRRDELEIPEEVLREALANAVVHREYSPYFVGQGVSVDIYPDRVEVCNPGGLWGGKTLGTLADGTSRCRNAALMTLMSLIELPSGKGFPSEGNGSGVPFMIREMRQRSLEEPRFTADLDQFTVVLWRSGVEVPSYRRWLENNVPSGLSRHEEAVLLTARRDGEVSVSGIRSLLRLDSDEIREIFRKLTSLGLLEDIGNDACCIKEGRHKRAPRGGAEREIVSYLTDHGAANVHEISEATGRSVASVRYYLSKLIDVGEIEATAPPSSKKRKYVIVRNRHS